MARSAHPSLEIVTGSIFRRTIRGLLLNTKIRRNIYSYSGYFQWYLIGVVFECHLPVSLLDLIVGGPLDNTQHLEIIFSPICRTKSLYGSSGREALSKYHVLQWNSLKVTHQTFFIFACFDQNPPYKSPSPSCLLSPSPLVISLRGGTGPAPTPTFSEIRSRDQYSTRRARTLVITSQKLKIGHNLTRTDCQEDCTWSPRSLHSLLTKVVTFLLNLTFLTVFAARDPRSNWICAFMALVGR